MGFHVIFHVNLIPKVNCDFKSDFKSDSTMGFHVIFSRELWIVIFEVISLWEITFTIHVIFHVIPKSDFH